MPDIEKTLPLHSLDPAPWNPKKAIHGRYKRGLRGSLGYFGNRDRLKVWANPQKRGRYYVLDGNQRLPELIEQAENRLLAEHFGLELDPDFGQPQVKAVAAIRADPENAKTLDGIRRRALDSQVEVRILRDLDPADARLFTLIFNRNHAVYDEGRVAALSDEPHRLSREALGIMARPDRAFIQPLARAPDGTVPTVAETLAARASILGSPESPVSPQPTQSTAPTADAPWGEPPPPPPSRPVHASLPGAAPLIPLMLSLTPEGYKEISERTLRCTARLFREATLKTALSQLEQVCLESDAPDIPLEEITREVALLTLNRHIESHRFRGALP